MLSWKFSKSYDIQNKHIGNQQIYLLAYIKSLQSYIFYPQIACNYPNILNIYKALEDSEEVVVMSKRKYKAENAFHIHLNEADGY